MVSPSGGHVIFYLLCEHQYNEIPNQFYFRYERRDYIIKKKNLLMIKNWKSKSSCFILKTALNIVIYAKFVSH